MAFAALKGSARGSAYGLKSAPHAEGLLDGLREGARETMGATDDRRETGPTGGRVRKRGALGVQPGDRLPAIALRSTAGREVDLGEESAHHHLVLFFYPGDGAGRTYPELSGCTPEACSFRDSLRLFRSCGALVFGVSLQSSARQREFVARERLSYELLSDESRRLVGALGIPVWVSNEGEQFVGRVTLVVERGGRVASVYADDEMVGHAQAAYEALLGLTS